MEKGQQWHMIRVEGNRAKKEEVEYRAIKKIVVCCTIFTNKIFPHILIYIYGCI